MHDGKRLLQAFDGLWGKYRKRLTACRHEAGEEPVHKLRISTRRLLSAIELLQTLAPQPELRKLRKALKAQLDGFDELRDTQVMLLEITSALDSLPQLQAFLQHLQSNEQRLLAQTPAVIEQIDSAKLESLLKKAHKPLQNELGKAGLKPAILSAIDAIYQTALQRYQAIDATQPMTIHRTRIAVKKLRYMLESAKILLPPLPENHLVRIQAYLTDMGEIQNSCVLLLSLKTFFAGEMPASVQTHYQHRHSTIIMAYMSRRKELLQFWRSNAELAMPWEQA